MAYMAFPVEHGRVRQDGVHGSLQLVVHSSLVAHRIHRPCCDAMQLRFLPDVASGDLLEQVAGSMLKPRPTAVCLSPSYQVQDNPGPRDGPDALLLHGASACSLARVCDGGRICENAVRDGHGDVDRDGRLRGTREIRTLDVGCRGQEKPSKGDISRDPSLCSGWGSGGVRLSGLISSSCFFLRAKEVELTSVIPESHRLLLDEASIDEASLETGIGDFFNLPCSVFEDPWVHAVLHGTWRHSIS